MKYLIVCMFVLLAVANTLAQYPSYPGFNPMLPFNPPVSRQWPINTQMWHAQDELGRASFGYAYPGQSAVNYVDAAGNMVGSWSYINPNGKLVATSYVADHRGFRVQSNDLPIAPVDNSVPPVVAPVVPVAPGVTPPRIKDVSKEVKPVVAVRKSVLTDVTVADNYQCLRPTDRRKRQTDQFPGGVFRMVASQIVPENKYPFMVALVTLSKNKKRSQHACGASLISSTKLLTAAHCITDDLTTTFDGRSYQANFGQHFRNATTTDAQVTRDVVAYVIHENYEPRSKANDIAILTLDSPVKFTETISPICLPSKCMDDNFVGRSVRAMGWGYTKEDSGTESDFLRSASFDVISNAKCSKTYGAIKDHEFCAYKEGKDTCQGDSGGPLITDHGNDDLNCRFVQVGVVSAGFGCARKGTPGVYMKVTSFVPWIKKYLYLQD